MDWLADRVHVASSLLLLQPRSKTYLFCDLVITSKEARNCISISAMKAVKKLDGIWNKWSKVKPVSCYTKNYELVLDEIKDLDAKSEEHQDVTWPDHATCCRHFHSRKKIWNKFKTKNKCNRSVKWRKCWSHWWWQHHLTRFFFSFKVK